MEEDLDLTGDRYDWLLTIFYISYIVFQVQVGQISTIFVFVERTDFKIGLYVENPVRIGGPPLLYLH